MQRSSDPKRRMPHVARTIGGGAGAALAMSLIMLAAPAAALAPASAFPHATWTPSSSLSVSGCSAARSTHITWSSATGIGHWKGDSWAHACGPASGGPTTSSYSSASASLTINDPVTLATGTGGVNVTWNLTGRGWVQASAPALSLCPKTVSTYSYNYNYTWINTTTVSRYCSDGAAVSVYASAYLWDSTTGTYFGPSNYWSGAAISAGHSVYVYSTKTTYSNPAYWGYNSTSTSTTIYGHTTHASFSGTVMPTWFINGTFSSTDKYVVVTYLSMSVYSDVYGWTRANGQAHFDGLTMGRAATLEPLSIW